MTAPGGDTLGAMSQSWTLINPFTEEPFRTLPLTTETQLAGIVARARAAQREWRQVPVGARVDVVSRMVPAFRGMAGAVALDITRPMGKPITASHNEIKGCSLSHLGFRHLTRPKSFHLRTRT